MWQQEVRNGGRKIKQNFIMKLAYAVLWLQNKGTSFLLAAIVQGYNYILWGGEGRGGEEKRLS